MPRPATPRTMRFALVILLIAVPSCADSGTVEVSDGWAGSSPPAAPTAALYLTIDNATSSSDRIVDVESDRCTSVELHASEIDDENVMRMRPASDDALTIPAHSTLAMEPGGLHVMCIEPKAPFVEGETVPYVLYMDRAGELPGEVPVENR